MKSIEYTEYDGWSHTDPILEGPMQGDQRLHQDLFDLLQEWTTTTNNSNISYDNQIDGTNNQQPIEERQQAFLSSLENSVEATKPICPKILVELARWINPF